MAVIQNLVEQIVDYAGLFPPAELPLEQVVHNYAKYRQGPWAWMLGRLVLPAARLDEFSEVAAATLPQAAGSGWMISALVPPSDSDGSAPLRKSLEAIERFNRRHSDSSMGLARVDTIEVRAGTSELIGQLAQVVPEGLNTFCEIPHQSDPVDAIRTIHQISGAARVFAKIRTGGVTADLIPTPEQVARFIRRCVENQVGFKATAGLHHPLRGRYRLTYEPDAAEATMFGYLNVFLAACFGFGAAASQKDMVKILRAETLDEFELSDLGIRWKNLDVAAARVSEIRYTKAISFGSCSFDEPTSELQALGLLGE